MNGQNNIVVTAQDSLLAAITAPVKVDSAKAETLVVYQIVNGERAGEEIKLVPSSKGASTQAISVQATESSSKNFRFEFEASGLVVTIIALGILVLMGYALSVLRSVLLGNGVQNRIPSDSQPHREASSHAKPATAPATSASSAPVAAPVSTELHPGISNEKLAAILGVAAAETLGPNTQVVKFRPMNQSDWTWAVQGRSHLHSNRLV